MNMYIFDFERKSIFMSDILAFIYLEMFFFWYKFILHDLLHTVWVIHLKTSCWEALSFKCIKI